MGKEIMAMPPPNLLFDPKKIEPLFAEINSVECKTNKDLKQTNSLYFYNFELGNVLVFYHKGKLRSNNLFELPISDIISAQVSNEKKRIGKKWFLTIKTSRETIVIRAQEKQVNAFKSILDNQKEKQRLDNETKEIIFTSGGSTKTLAIHPYSSKEQVGEETIFSLISGTPAEDGEWFLVTNYRVLENYWLGGLRALTHGEYEDVIASNVEKRREEDIVGGVDETPSMWNALSGITNTRIIYNKSTHHSSSTETEFGDVLFMNDGKQVMAWKNFPDPNSLVKMINSAKAHFKTTPTAPPSSGGEDPIKALKLRFAKGEITKKQFKEMMDILAE